MNSHSFDVNIAKKFGVPVAIVLNHIAFWIQKNQSNEKHFHDGRFWTYNSVKAFLEIFPYWTTDQMRTVLEKLKESGLILTGNYNKKGYDQTMWYALSDEGLKLYNLPIPPVDNNTAIWEKSQMDSGEIPNGFGENPKPIPDIKPDIKTDKRKSSYFKNDKSVDNSKGDGQLLKDNPMLLNNAKRHEFAQSMNQMASEAKHIAEHEERMQEFKRAPMPDDLRQKIKNLRHCSR